MGGCGDHMRQRADRLKNFLLLPICVDKAVGGETNTVLTYLDFILLCHGNSYAITTASGHCPVVQYVLGITSVLHLLHGMASLFL